MTDRDAAHHFTIDWQGIALSVTYHPHWPGRPLPGLPAIAHLELRVLEPRGAALPVTETGYRSHFVCPDDVDALGGATSYAAAWPDAEAKHRGWRPPSGAGQLSLF